jgi:hypothetical protein
MRLALIANGVVMNRLLTTLVQLSIAIPALIMLRMMWKQKEWEKIEADFEEWNKSH